MGEAKHDQKGERKSESGNKTDDRQARCDIERQDGKATTDHTTTSLFAKLWSRVIDDNSLAAHGFRRFKTTHLLNLRFLEEEIDSIDHQIYQAGSKVGYKPGRRDRLGLKHMKIDVDARGAENAITRDLILKLRQLLKQYGTSRRHSNLNVAKLGPICR